MEHTVQERERDEDDDEAAMRTAELDRFTHAVSHDLRGPLANLKGMTAELALVLQELPQLAGTRAEHSRPEDSKRLDHLLNHEIPEILGFINTSVLKMDRLMRQLHELSRIGDREVRFSAVDLNQLMNIVRSRLRGQMESAGGTMEVDPLPVLQADPQILEEVFGHLLSNAIKFRREEQPLLIRISARNDGQSSHIIMADNGRGIDKAHWEDIFLPGRRVGKQDRPGDGRGLPIVKALLRRHGGTILCSSEREKGSEFTVRLPRQAGLAGT